MAYIDSKLASGERVLRSEHQHWFVLVADARYGILAIAAAIVLAILSTSLGQSGFRDILGWVIVGLVLGGLAYIGWQILRWVNEEFVVTTRRVLQLEGVLNKRVLDSSLEKINDAVLTQSLFGRIFGFGDLDILTASETGISRLRMLKDADNFKRAMLEAKHELELELSGARPLPSPPLRASSAPPSGAAPAQAPAQGSAPPSEAPRHAEMTPDELTRTLASLADLRDRGAISPEEYEAKKADLLRRL
jgi:hypothetical protein